MTDTLNVTIKERTKGEDTWFEGVVALPGAQPTKLVRKSDGSYKFGTPSAVRSSARNFAKQFGFTAEVEAPAKKAAKKKTKAATAPAPTAE